MVEMVEQRQELRLKPTEEDDYNHSDLFNSLLTAAEEESASGTPTLTQRELVGWCISHLHMPVTYLISLLSGNIFIFLLAGHEVRLHHPFLLGRTQNLISLSTTVTCLQTTANSLAFAFGLLACYLDEQQKLYDHVKSVLADGRAPVSTRVLRARCICFSTNNLSFA